MGRTRHVWLRGVLGWGVALAALACLSLCLYWLYAEGLAALLFPWLAFVLLLSLVAGYFWGALTWWSNERDYLAERPEASDLTCHEQARRETVTRTEHPHVVRRLGVCGNSPVIRGTRITVRHIAVLWKHGETVEAITRAYPHLQTSWVHDAISYYLDHREEIEQEVEDNRIENVLARTGGVMDHGGIVRFPASGPSPPP
jgi:uncharacterized protein (DUF433 family)